jgi:hypothetical protein
LDYTELLAEVRKELTMPGGNFAGLFGQDPNALHQAEMIAAVALVAADRLYSRLTRSDFEMRDVEEHRG